MSDLDKIWKYNLALLNLFDYHHNAASKTENLHGGDRQTD